MSVPACAAARRCRAYLWASCFRDARSLTSACAVRDVSTARLTRGTLWLPVMSRWGKAARDTNGVGALTWVPGRCVLAGEEAQMHVRTRDTLSARRDPERENARRYLQGCHPQSRHTMMRRRAQPGTRAGRSPVAHMARTWSLPRTARRSGPMRIKRAYPKRESHRIELMCTPNRSTQFSVLPPSRYPPPLILPSS